MLQLNCTILDGDPPTKKLIYNFIYISTYLGLLTFCWFINLMTLLNGHCGNIS